MNKEEVKQALFDYNWQIREIARIKTSLKDYEFTGVAASGIESVMPKGSGTSDTIAGEVIRREAKNIRLSRMEEQVKYIQDRVHKIDDPIYITIIECLLDGLTVSEISRHLRCMRQTVYNKIDKIVEQMME
jgi:DNA-binding NarL/FixJ family response regulator